MLFNNAFDIQSERVRIMVISSRDNPKIKRLAKLISDRKARAEAGEFVIEGVRGCIDAAEAFARGEVRLCALYYVPQTLESCADHLPVGSLLGLPEDMRFEITEDIAARIADTESGQGVFAVVKNVDKPFSSEMLRPGGKYLILDGLQDPGNLGTMLRTADAVGVDGIVLTGHCVDLYNPKVVRSAVGSLMRVNVCIENDTDALMSAFADKGIRTAAAVISGGTSVLDFDFEGGCAVVIGNEGRGLPESHVAMCSNKVTIGMKGNINSLNAAAAGTILLWEMTRGQK